MAAMEAGDEPPDDQENVTSWTNPWIAEYKRRQAMLMEMRPFEVVAMLRDLEPDVLRLQQERRGATGPHMAIPRDWAEPAVQPRRRRPLWYRASATTGQLPRLGELALSGQRAVLRDIWPRVGKQLSEFEQGEYTAKRLAVFEADEAKLLVELRNYSQHQFLPYLNPAWQFSQTMPMAEFQFRSAC